MSDAVEVQEPSELAPFDQLKADVQLFLAEIPEVKVTDAASEATAREHWKKLKTMTKALESKRVELTKPLLERKKEIDTYAGEVGRPLDDKDKLIKAELERYTTEQHRLKVEAELRAQEERAAAEREAERKRLEAEREAEEKWAAEQARLEAAAKKERDDLAAAAQAAADSNLAALGISSEAELERIAAEQRQSEKIAEEERQAAIKKHERDFAANQARIDREQKEANKAAKATAQSVATPKYSSMFWTFEIIIPSEIPREYCAPVDALIRVGIANGVRDIPGVRIYEAPRVANRS